MDNYELKIKGDDSMAVKGEKIPYKVTSDTEPFPYYCFAYNANDAVKRSQFNQEEGVIRVNETSAEEVKDRMSQYYRPNRKIFAIVKIEDFIKVSKRCKEEGFSNVGQLFTELVKSYANGKIDI